MLHVARVDVGERFHREPRNPDEDTHIELATTEDTEDTERNGFEPPVLRVLRGGEVMAMLFTRSSLISIRSCLS